MHTPFQKYFVVLDKVTHILYAATEKGILSVKQVENCQFRQYEEQRLMSDKLFVYGNGYQDSQIKMNVTERRR